MNSQDVDHSRLALELERKTHEWVLQGYVVSHASPHRVSLRHRRHFSVGGHLAFATATLLLALAGAQAQFMAAGLFMCWLVFGLGVARISVVHLAIESEQVKVTGPLANTIYDQKVQL